MPRVIDIDGHIVFRGRSDHECVCWWRLEGVKADRLEDTNELMSDLAQQLGLEP